ncbi:MAG: YebC/PmpR family DNA-binding transcriptional regulator [Candidatus Gracilibacteria bacterium]|nr:YebC/PmpR family DNA-binding transcriptional regulator [Candidatus Gracilibacteria bacterium]
MAGHSKWHNIKHKKAAADSQRGKVFSIHAKLIALAAQGGGDPDLNPSLADAIAKAKADNVPNDNIDRAIKKGTGEDKSAAQIQEITYEGYAPGGVAVIVKTLTDNKNRTASNIRHTFSKFGGNLGESGAVSWMFNKKGVIIISLEKYSFDELEELIFETSAEDYSEEDGMFRVFTTVEDFKDTKAFFEGKNIELEFADFDYIADNQAEVTEMDKALKITKMMEMFEEDEDVENVYNNANISSNLQKEVDDFIEKNSFKS